MIRWKDLVRKSLYSEHAFTVALEAGKIPHGDQIDKLVYVQPGTIVPVVAALRGAYPATVLCEYAAVNAPELVGARIMRRGHVDVLEAAVSLVDGYLVNQIMVDYRTLTILYVSEP